MSKISKSKERLRFHWDLSIVYIPSIINQFIFGHGVVIYFIMQSILEKSSKNYSAILFILSTVTAIITPAKSDEISDMSIYILL